jgi:hypothetical protein
MVPGLSPSMLHIKMALANPEVCVNAAFHDLQVFTQCPKRTTIDFVGISAIPMLKSLCKLEKFVPFDVPEG